MGKRLTTEEFINKAKLVHGDKYDYSLVNYITSKMSVKIICPIHGEFEQKPNYHLSKCGCTKCGIETINIKLKINKQELINKFNLIHNFKYYYSFIYFNNLHDKIISYAKQKKSEKMQTQSSEIKRLYYNITTLHRIHAYTGCRDQKSEIALSTTCT